MKRKNPLLIVLLVLLLVALFALPLTVSTAMASVVSNSPTLPTLLPDTPYGTTLDSKDAGSQTQASTDVIKSIGMSWVRLQPHWAKQQSTQGGAIDWSLIDSQVAMAQNDGLRVDYVMQDAPTWAIDTACSHEPVPSLFAQYAQAVVAHFGNSIQAIEIGNEGPSYDTKCGNQAGPSHYEAEVNAVEPAIRSAGFTGLVGMFGFTGYQKTSLISSWFTSFLGSSASKLLDYLQFHFYRDGSPNDTSSSTKPTLPVVITTIHNAQVATGDTHPVWLGEYGWLTKCDNGHPAPCGYVTPTQQSQYEQQVLDDARTSGVVTHAFVFNVQPNSSGFSLYQNGALMPAGTMEQAYIQQYPTWQSSPTPTPTTTDTPTPTPTPTGLDGITNVFVIMMENQDWSNIKGNSHAPYINGTLLKQGAYATNYHAIGHPSLPNYLWIAGGQKFGVTTDSAPVFSISSSANIFDQMSGNWRVYAEGITAGTCPSSNISGTHYAARHNPSVYFSDLKLLCATHDVPYTQLSSDLTANSVAGFNFIVPNLCDDMHDLCSGPTKIAQGDTWLSKQIPMIQASPAYKSGNSLVMVIWDEGSSTGTNVVGCILLGGHVKAGYASSVAYTHGSTLRTIEEIFSKPLLADAQKQVDLSDMPQ